MSTLPLSPLPSQEDPLRAIGLTDGGASIRDLGATCSVQIGPGMTVYDVAAMRAIGNAELDPRVQDGEISAAQSIRERTGLMAFTAIDTTTEEGREDTQRKLAKMLEDAESEPWEFTGFGD